jgi:hypothetical protein
VLQSLAVATYDTTFGTLGITMQKNTIGYPHLVTWFEPNLVFGVLGVLAGVCASVPFVLFFNSIFADWIGGERSCSCWTYIICLLPKVFF